jgi:hypothetical protein
LGFAGKTRNANERVGYLPGSLDANLMPRGVTWRDPT